LTSDEARLPGLLSLALERAVADMNAQVLPNYPDLHPGQARLLRLTERGRQLEQDVTAATARLALQWQEELGDQPYEALPTALQQLAHNVDPSPYLDHIGRDDIAADDEADVAVAHGPS
jgi:hypothetical protein